MGAEGLDPQRMDEDLTPITRHTLRRQLNQRYGDTPVLGMGYGIGWLTHSALVLDQMDNAGRLLVSIARYTYDKNMNYADSTRGIDWRKWSLNLVYTLKKAWSSTTSPAFPQ